MAITQKDIVNLIPLKIDCNTFDLVLDLRALAFRGWGMENRLVDALNKLLDFLTDEADYGALYHFNRDNFTVTKVECLKCHDRKMIATGWDAENKCAVRVDCKGCAE